MPPLTFEAAHARLLAEHDAIVVRLRAYQADPSALNDQAKEWVAALKAYVDVSKSIFDLKNVWSEMRSYEE